MRKRTNEIAPARLVVGDESAYFRSGLERVFEDHAQLKIVGVASAPHDVPQLVESLCPDVVLAAFEPTSVAIGLVELVRPCPVLVLTWHSRTSDLVEALQAGVRGLLAKNVSPEALVPALLSVAAGQFVLGPGWERALLDPSRLAVNVSRRQVDRVKFTARELQIISLIVTGASNKAISNQLGIALQTVKNHTQRVLAKAEVTSRSELTAWAMHRGLTSGSATDGSVADAQQRLG